MTPNPLLLGCLFVCLCCILIQEETRPELFATTGDYLRLWKVGESEAGRNRTNLEVILNNVSCTPRVHACVCVCVVLFSCCNT